ncbi:MAG: peroxiredoxin [Polyangiaceae bacterium]
MLTVGDKIPSFSLQTDSGDTLTDQSFAGKTLVVYFYPKDDTPGCTREAIAFTQQAKDFAKAGAVIVGVSKDSKESHARFREKYALSIPLLSDPDLTLHKSFGAYGTKMLYGRESQGTIRSTFVIDEHGTVVRVFPSVKVDGHAEKVLAGITGASVPAGTGQTVMPPAKAAKAKKASASKVVKNPSTKRKPAQKVVAPKKSAAKKPAKKPVKKPMKKPAK